MPILHELGETIRQRALIIIVSDFFVDTSQLRECLEHLRFRKHDVAAFHLLDPAELEFNFHRPIRFLDMEGGPAIFAEPNEIADRYFLVLQQFLADLSNWRNQRRNRHRLPSHQHRRQLRANSRPLPGRPHPRRRCAVNFLQPLLLIALPLAALPIIIHLINQRRYQTMRWGAMMFLLAANRMSRGYARLRQWLILAMRIAVVAALVFAVSRPLASGWVGFALGGRADTTIILLDRSPSMQQTAVGGSASKLDTATQQLAATLSTLGSSHWILIDSVNCKPTELQSPQAPREFAQHRRCQRLRRYPRHAASRLRLSSTKSRRPHRNLALLRSARHDWNAVSGRWQALRDAFTQFKAGVRFHLLAYPQPAPGNLSIRLTGLRRQTTSDGAELLISLHVARESGAAAPDESFLPTAPSDNAPHTIPLTFEIDGARSELPIDMVGDQFDLKDHPLPLQSDHPRGWGRVSVPADLNPADNDCYFAYDVPLAAPHADRRRRRSSRPPTPSRR